MDVTAPELLREGFVAVSVESPEPLQERLSRVQLDDAILALAERAREVGVAWDKVFVFERDDE